MSNNSTKQQELKHIGSIVRALVTSRKPPCYLRDVLREYPEVESKPLPYKSMGYKNAQDLLEDTGEFIFRGYGREDVIITAKFSNKSAHISSMVRSQKSSKTTRIAPVKAMKQPPRMPLRSNGYGDRINNNNNTSNNNYRGSSSLQQKQYNNQTQQQQQQQQQQQHQPQSLQRQKSMGSSSNNQAKDLREMLNSKKNLKPQQTSAMQQSSLASKVIQPQQQQAKVQPKHNNDNGHRQSAANVGPRPILGATKTSSKDTQNPMETKRTDSKSQQQQQQQQSQPMTNKQQSQKVEKSPLETKVLKPQQRLQVIQNNQQQQQQHSKQQPTQQLSKAASTQPKTPPIVATAIKQQPASSSSSSQAYNQMEQSKSNAAGIQNRLKVYVKPEYTPKQPITYNHQFSNAPKLDMSAFSHHQFNQHQKMDAISTVVQYCRTKQYAAPHFKVLRGKFSRGTFSCCVRINDAIFSTYPHEYETEYLAKEACAKSALDKIKMQEKKKPLPACSFTDMELLDKLFTELLNHPHGIFAKNLPEWFETTFQQQLPDNWWALIQTSSLFTTETGLSKVIIFANENADRDSTSLSSGDLLTKTIQIDPIRLPWSEEYWNIFITYCTSTVTVWGRLFGKDYSIRFGSLVNDIEVYMSTKKERPVSIARTNIYLVHINECWHRVRVEELDKSKGTALCFFIDFGDADWLTVDQLHICETHFLKLPAQAVPFSLYGLEDFEGNPYARKCLDDVLPTKSLVGRIFTKESEFYDTNSKSHGKIQVVFFDTSTPEDVNINHQLLNTICSETLVPEIKKSTVTNVIVTHINDNGDIYLQVNSSELKYLQKLLQQTIEAKFNSEQHKTTYEDFKRSSLFLICDDDDSNDIKWYRASLADTNIQPGSDNYQMFYVDIGLTKTTNISKIFLLDSLSMALSRFPNQAIKVRLHNIPDITQNIVGRIRGLLPNGCEALARLSVPGAVPLVTIYTRLEGPGTLCTINDVIRIEHELEGCSDLLQGCAVDDSLTNKKSSQDYSKKLSTSNSGSSLTSPTTPTGNPFIDVTRGLTLTSIPGSPQKSSDLPKLQNYAAIPNKNDYFETRITMSANPSNFTIQPFKEFPNLRLLMKELQEFCENSDEFIPTDMVEIGEAYAAKNPDGFFHRVTVVKKYGDMIHVSFCDFGDIATLESSQLKTLPLKFRQLPKMAVQAKLYGIKAVTGDWTLDDCLFFRKLTVGKTFVSVIKDVNYDQDCSPPKQILELELIDVSTDEDILIHELLLNDNRAINEA